MSQTVSLEMGLLQDKKCQQEQFGDDCSSNDSQFPNMSSVTLNATLQTETFSIVCSTSDIDPRTEWHLFSDESRNCLWLHDGCTCNWNGCLKPSTGVTVWAHTTQWLTNIHVCRMLWNPMNAWYFSSHILRTLAGIMILKINEWIMLSLPLYKWFQSAIRGWCNGFSTITFFGLLKQKNENCSTSFNITSFPPKKAPSNLELILFC